MSQFRDLLNLHAEKAGSFETRLAGVYIYRADQPNRRQPSIYEPNIIIVGQGSKCAYMDEQAFCYNPKNYLILSAPLPLESQIMEASPEKPFLSMSVNIDVPDLRAMIMELGEIAPREQPLQAAISSSQITESIQNAAIRLLQTLTNEKDRKILGPLYKRELLYLMLEGEQGAYLQALALFQGQFHHIAKVMHQIHTHCEQPFDVETMAQEANMGVSTFFANFKAATSFSPLQYVKRIRLNRARSLILEHQLTASQAAIKVGYRSASQFSREFKRLFGFPPKAVRNH